MGVAAHWKYKEGGKGAEKSFDRKITWMRQLLEQAQEGQGNELAGALDAELTEDRVYALSPKDEVLDLPQGATPLDFAYQVHTMVGHRCRGAKVNGRIVPLTYRLRSGDRVEILTGKEADPRRDWLMPALGFLASNRSREKVRSWFHKLDRARNVQAGRELLERELKRLGLQHSTWRWRRRNSMPTASMTCTSRWRWATPARTRSAVRCWKRSVRPTSRHPRRRCRGRPRAARTWVNPSSPCRAWATCWCSWHVAASRWPANRLSAT